MRCACEPLPLAAIRSIPASALGVNVPDASIANATRFDIFGLGCFISSLSLWLQYRLWLVD